MPTPVEPIPVHVIAGPLGVGKTTAILHLVHQRGRHERIGLLVNDFGPIGIDGAVLEAEAGGTVVPVAGGCVCCAAAEGLADGMGKLLRSMSRPDRIIVEPSGLAQPSAVVDVLRQLSSDGRFHVAPVVALLDVSDPEPLTSPMPYYRWLIDAADILVGNRADQADPGERDRFLTWARDLYPPKLRVMLTEHGRLDAEVLDLAPTPHTHDADRKPQLTLAAPTDHAQTHQHAHAASDSVTWPAGHRFEDARIISAIKQLRDGHGLVRVKGVFHTQHGWRLYDLARGQVTSRRTAYRRDNRLDWISDHPVDPDMINHEIRSAISSQAR